jgi:glycerol-3-phosphate O-acyltransferase/dihydroxyacetone phosphate acyltransferase
MASKAGATVAGAQSQTKSESTPQKAKELYPMVNWKYDLFLYVIGNLVDSFFREVVPRGAWRVPQTGPVLFVAAPHANQVSYMYTSQSWSYPITTRHLADTSLLP